MPVARVILHCLFGMATSWSAVTVILRCVETGLPYAAASVAWCFVVWVMDGSPIVGRA